MEMQFCCSDDIFPTARSIIKIIYILNWHSLHAGISKIFLGQSARGDTICDWSCSLLQNQRSRLPKSTILCQFQAQWAASNVDNIFKDHLSQRPTLLFHSRRQAYGFFELGWSFYSCLKIKQQQVVRVNIRALRVWRGKLCGASYC